jgi:hypothetical protein
MKKTLKKRQLTDDEIDALVIAEADDPSAWGEAVFVPASKSPRPSWIPDEASLEDIQYQVHVLDEIKRG